MSGGIEIDFLERGPKSTSLQCWIETVLALVWGIESNLISVWESKLTRFRAEVKIDLDFVCGPKMTCFSVGIDSPRFCMGGQN